MSFKPQLAAFLLSGLILYSQEIPPIQKYASQETGSGNQNWMISQGLNQNIYIANNKGLLEFNGSKWILHPSQDGTIFRSVKSLKNRIYTGTYRDFGYWLPKENGVLSYTSLVDELQIEILEDEQFWNIMEFNELLVFQSLDRLITVDLKEKSVSYIDPEEKLLKAFKAGEQLYFQEYNKGLFRVEKGESKLLGNNPDFKNQIILSVFTLGDRRIAVTNLAKFYDISKPENITQWIIPAQKKLSEYTLYSFIELSNGHFGLGTIANGYIELDRKGNLIQTLNQKRGLSNNTILSLFEDNQKNIWVGLGNGVNYINTASPFYEYKEEWEALGTVYSSKSHEGYDYLGTNHGLYVKQNFENSYELIPETKGQVWSLDLIKGSLFCGHDNGSFIITKKNAQKIGIDGGTWIFKEHPSNGNIILQGTYNGIHVLERENNQWKYRNKIEGFDISSRFLEFANDSVLIVAHEYKGVYRLEINDTLEKIQKQRKAISVEKGINAGLTAFDKVIYYYYKKGVYRFDEQRNVFVKDSLISSLIKSEQYSTGKMTSDDEGRLWFLTKDKTHYFTKDILRDKLIHKSFYLDQKNRKSISGFEHIGSVNQDNYIIGTNEGYVAVNLKAFKTFDTKVKIDAIIVSDSVRVSMKKSISLAYSNNNILFEFSANAYQKYYPVQYQYKLEGYQETWSAWNEEAFIKFENLDFGTYVFHVRSKVGEKISESKASKSITILAPWYWSNSANIIYIVSFFIFIAILKAYYEQKNKKEQLDIIKKNNQKAALIQLENQKELIRIRNEQLQQDVESKSRELVIATMSTLRRNEFLNKIKKDLSEIETEPRIDLLIKKINKNLKRNDDWEYFEEAFNNADKGFFKILKTRHPKLTNNDLRLCAYLRLNLSSKEIAPLLNISVQSVEIKRYRLRKKMNLSRDQRIVDYIITM
ncbi:MAG: LuxR family transcriptional regulator [Candidatus Arcticimaribacter sp.]|nr:MAG: LuxR family transcriptional regulator [Candidatus Arcticimaribacter sp.]